MRALRGLCLCGLSVLLGVAVARAESTLEGQLAAAAAALDTARTQQVDLLSPRNFTEAGTAEEDAQREFKRGGKVNRVQQKLSDSAKALEVANRVAEIGRVALAAPLKTRADADSAEATRHAADEWRRASQRFTEAAQAVERGDVKSGQKLGAESEVLFRQAELAAVKGRWLNEARALIRQADEAKVEKYAPRTLAVAKHDLAEAETEINQNRYDTDLPRTLATQAVYEARHALYLAKLIQDVPSQASQDRGLENLILSWEAPLKQIASEMGQTAHFDDGFDKPLRQMLEYASKQQQLVGTLKQDVADRDGQIASQSAEIKRLEDRLGGVSEERVALQRRVDAQAELRANVAKTEGLFAPTQAHVYRQGDDVVISLTGIDFTAGKSTINTASYALLGKVQEALRLFPGIPIVVEGHTDSIGSDSANLLLSQDRADAVKQYLISNLNVDAEKINSIGYGETRPVATNDTAEGRTRNRRIDVVIRMEAQ